MVQEFRPRVVERDGGPFKDNLIELGKSGDFIQENQIHLQFHDRIKVLGQFKTGRHFDGLHASGQEKKNKQDKG